MLEVRHRAVPLNSPLLDLKSLAALLSMKALPSLALC